jgi:hypothetical protein
MNQREIKLSFKGHTSIRLDSGTFLMLPPIEGWKALEAADDDPECVPDRVTIKAFTRVRPLEATVIGRTLHVMLPIPDFERLGSELRAKSERPIELSFRVDEQGNASELALDSRSLQRDYKESYTKELAPAAPARKSAG